jgi:hypothetical protein
VCGGENPIALDACATCGTPFADAMRGAPARPEVDPSDAVRASLLFPGVGHRRLGLPLEGLVRGLSFAVTFGMVILLLFIGWSSAASLVVLLLLLTAAVVIYVGSAYEARQLALGGGPLVSSRALLWFLVVVIFVSVVLLAVAVVTATRG